MYIICLLLLPILVHTQNLTIPCTYYCDSECPTLSTSRCMACLQQYYQYYDLSSETCKCLEDFQPAINEPNYCCPLDCKTCGMFGCTTCWNHAQLTGSDVIYFFSCQCQNDYYYHQASRQCRCRSDLQPNEFYEDRELDICYPCPNGCTCTQLGCISCSAGTSREVRLNKYNVSICHCLSDLVQSEGSCQCPSDCSCQQGKITSCYEQSYRSLTYGKWQCNKGFIEKNGNCWCDTSLYYIDYSPDQQYSCICNAKYRSATPYYFLDEVDQSCHYCFSDCLCDPRGCYSCPDSTAAQSVDFVCSCINNFTETYLNCQCSNPFYEVPLLVNGIQDYKCYCSSEKYPTQYYFIQESGSCLKCPKQCTCSSSGCISCSPNFLRNVTQLPNNRSSCPCHDNAFENQDFLCECSYMYAYDSSSRLCKCDVLKLNSTFQDPDKSTCTKCPTGCTCDSTGCSSCDSQVLRAIETNSQGRFTCYCVPGTIELVSGVCGCSGPYVYNTSTRACECMEPYYLDQQGKCTCKSAIDSENYYYDMRVQKCYQCPFTCICNDGGCVQCTNDSLRFTMVVTGSGGLSICPCFSYAFLINNYCTLCYDYQYFYSGVCVVCYECMTCDRRGCLSCTDDMVLINYTCVCLNPNLTNLAGFCDCPSGFYYNQTSQDCWQCPLYCKDCILNLETAEIWCLSCYYQGNRENDPSNNCVCLDGYIQTFPISSRCCPIGCASCDQTGCLSCDAHSHRILAQSWCACPTSMIEVDYVCECPDGTYIFDFACLNCPLNCETCAYNFESNLVQCLSCAQDMNRDPQTTNCQCFSYFMETSPLMSQYCVSVFCANMQQQCTKCIQPYILTEGICLCVTGEFFSYRQSCEPCGTHPGCLECDSLTICTLCDQSSNYYLSYYKCILQNVFESLQISEQRSVTVQFRPIISIVSIRNLSTPVLNPIYSAKTVEKDQVIAPVFLSEYAIQVNDGLITVTFDVSQSYYATILGMYGTFVNEELDLIYEKINLKTELIIYPSPLKKQQTGLMNFFGVLGLGLGYGVYLLGYKHNQIVFIMQTLCFAAFTINNTLLPNIYFGHQLRFSYYNFGHHILEHLMQENYYERSTGNYHFLTKDANIFRVAGVAMILAFVNLTVLATLALSIVLDTTFFNSFKKLPLSRYIGRTLEFVYKTTMYPLIYFSLQMMVTWSRTSMIDNQFALATNVTSAIILTTYAMCTIAEFWLPLTSKFYKFESLTEFISCLLCSISILECGEVSWLILVVFVVLSRDLVYIWIRKEYLQDDSSKRPLTYLPILFQLALLILMVFKVEIKVMMPLLVVFLVLGILTSFDATRKYNHRSQNDKMAGSIEVATFTEKELADWQQV